MAAATTLLVIVMTILFKQIKDLPINALKIEQMWQQEAFLRHKMMQLLQDMKWIRSPQEDPVLSRWQLCLFWAAASVVLMEICWLTWKMKFTSCTCKVQDSPGSEEEDDKEEEEEMLKRRRHSVRLFSMPHILPMQELSEMCRDVKKMVHDILHICRELSKDTFMPQMHPATGQNSVYESWSIFEKRILYQLLVFLQPPPRHSFKLEVYGGAHLPERCSNIRVVLECTCSRKTEDIPCFVHPSENNQTAQNSPLLQTLCTGSYLDVEEIACWVQNSVQTAWENLPQWQHWQLTLLPSSHSCRVLLSGPSEVQLCAALVFAVEQGFPGTFLILQ